MPCIKPLEFIGTITNPVDRTRVKIRFDFPNTGSAKVFPSMVFISTGTWSSRPAIDGMLCVNSAVITVDAWLLRSAPVKYLIVGTSSRRATTIALTGLPGNPKIGLFFATAKIVGLPGLTAIP